MPGRQAVGALCVPDVVSEAPDGVPPPELPPSEELLPEDEAAELCDGLWEVEPPVDPVGVGAVGLSVGVVGVGPVGSSVGVWVGGVGRPVGS